MRYRRSFFIGIGTAAVALVSIPSIADAQNAGAPLLLPSGQILMLSNQAVLYTPTGSPKSSWAPTITTAPSSISSGQTYQVSGTQFGGMGQGISFGDEYQNATNYPLVRITNKSSGKVVYARTHGISSMGVQTGNATITTSFDVPSGIGSGASTLVVVTNGIASTPVSVTVSAKRSAHRIR